MEVKFVTHVCFSVSMKTMNKKWPQALFPITTSSLLKHANHAMHGRETCYSCVFQCFHDNHEQKMASGTFPITTSSHLKLANHTMHGSETWYACVFQHFHNNHGLGHFSLKLLHFSNLQTIQCMEVKLGTHVYFSISITTMALGIFP